MNSGGDWKTARGRMQVAAFQIEYELLGRGEDGLRANTVMNRIMRFAIALWRTRDDVVDGILKDNPDLVDEWVKSCGCWDKDKWLEHAHELERDRRDGRQLAKAHECDGMYPGFNLLDAFDSMSELSIEYADNVV